MLQLVLQLSRQELELNLQRMRMEEELELAMALSASSAMDDDEDALLLARKPMGVPADFLEHNCPKQTYRAATIADRKARGVGSRLPGGDECTVCQGEMTPEDEVRLLPCRHAFHAACCDPWFARSTCCPTCRRDVVSGVCRGDAAPSP